MSLKQEQLDYLVSLVESSDKKDWSRAISDLDLNIHSDSLRKAFNVSDFSGYSVYKFMRNIIENNFMSDEEIVRLEELRDKEYKERVRLQDANREKRKFLRDFSRLESIKEYIGEKLEDYSPLNFTPCNSKIQDGCEASVMISDAHIHALVDNIFNYYNEDVAKERFNELANEIIKICKHDKIKILNVETLGDNITGNIHGSTVAQSEEDVVDQVVVFCEIFEGFLIRLREEVPVVKAYIVWGNHGRCGKKGEYSEKTNFERFIPTILKKSLKNTDIKIITNGNEDFINYKLQDGREIVCTHGTKDSPINANNTFSDLLGKKIYEVHMGHFHNYQVKNGTVVNGSIMGTDEYAVSIRKHQTPKQIMKVYRDGLTTTYEIELT